MKTKRTFIILLVALPFICGCGNEDKSGESSRSLVIGVPSRNIYGRDTSMKVRFGMSEEKDENTIAMEKAAEQWNRNMCLRSGYSPLGEYVEKYGQNP